MAAGSADWLVLTQEGPALRAEGSAVPAPVPYANLANPQTLNLYAMVSDDPESFADLDGHCCSADEIADAVDFVAGFLNSLSSNNGVAVRVDARGDQTFASGQTAGDVAALIQGGVEIGLGTTGVQRTGNPGPASERTKPLRTNCPNLPSCGGTS